MDLGDSSVSMFGDISSVSTDEFLSPLARIAKNQKFASGEMVEAILEWVAGELGHNALVAAKKQFFEKTGPVFPDDEFYHQMMSYFLDCFCFESPNEKSFFQQYSDHLEQVASVDPIVLERFRALKNFRHSIFQVRGLGIRSVVLMDLLSGEKTKIKIQFYNEVFRYHKRGLIQGFVFVKDQAAYFSPGVFTHSPEVTSFIKRRIHQHRKQGTLDGSKCLLSLAKARISTKRHKHRPARELYAFV